MGNCQSCGMPMEKPEDYGGGQTTNPYCKYCTDDQGKLLPKDKVREKMIQFQMKSLNKAQEQAEADVDKHMALMPAWKIGGPAVTPGSPAKPIVADQPAMPPKPSPVRPSPASVKPPAFSGAQPSFPPSPGPGLAGQPSKPSTPSVSKPGAPSPLAKPTPKPEPPDIGMPKPSGKPGGLVSDEPPVKPETPPTKSTLEPPVSESEPESSKPKEPPMEPLIDLTEGEQSDEPSEPGEETSPGME